MAKNMGVIEQRKAFIKGCHFIDRARKKYCTKYRVLGIDPSITSTGYALFIGKSIRTGSIKPKTWGFSRLVKTEMSLRKLTDEKQPFVGIEGYAMNTKWGREKMGEVGGVIRRFLYFKKRPFMDIAVLSLKSWLKAKQKQQIMLEILDRYGIKIKDEDAADAFVIADMIQKALYMANEVIIRGLEDPEDVRLFFKDGDYRERGPLEDLFVYQANSLFKLIMNHGSTCEFFLKERPTL